jgi:hypothetical protein
MTIMHVLPQFYTYLEQTGSSGAIVTTSYDGVAINFAGSPGAIRV